MLYIINNTKIGQKDHIIELELFVKWSSWMKAFFKWENTKSSLKFGLIQI